MSEDKDRDRIRAASEQFVNGLVAAEPAVYEDLLDDAIVMRIYDTDGLEIRRGRELVVERLQAEWASWPDATARVLTVTADPPRAAVEYRVQGTADENFVEHNRAAVLAFQDGRVMTAHIYPGAPLPSSRRQGYVAPASLSDDEVNKLLESANRFDVRDPVPMNVVGYMNDRRLFYTSGYGHPGANFVGGVHWTVEEADERIDEMIACFRERDAGFQWFVGPSDTPADLPQRLEAHGLVLAGEHGIMARRGLADLDIPSNPEVEIVVLDGSNHEHNETVLQIIAETFHLSEEQVEQERGFFLEQLQDPDTRRKHPSYLAFVDGEPAAVGRLNMSGSVAHMSGAGTLEKFRGQRLYSTLLRRRLEDAAAASFEIATIDAAPMSRAIVGRYGFQEFNKTLIYAWMPVIDMDVINTLVPTE